MLEETVEVGGVVVTIQQSAKLFWASLRLQRGLQIALRPSTRISENRVLEMTKDVLIVPLKILGAKRLAADLIPKTGVLLV